MSVLFDKNYGKFLPVTCILLSACLCAYPPCMGVFHQSCCCLSIRIISYFLKNCGKHIFLHLICMTLQLYTVKPVESYKLHHRKILNCNTACFWYVTSVAEKNKEENENLLVTKRSDQKNWLYLRRRKLRLSSLGFGYVGVLKYFLMKLQNKKTK